jgi:branched-chain amino acid aminotransferase
MNSRMGQLEALKNGYDTRIFLNNKGKVSEGPGSCLFIVKDGVLITPTLEDSVLESITRDTIIKIAKDFGIEVIERSIDKTELYTCDEAFLCGSAMEITPIYLIDHYNLDKKEGEITKKLHQIYLNIVTGEMEEFSHWLTKVYE